MGQRTHSPSAGSVRQLGHANLAIPSAGRLRGPGVRRERFQSSKPGPGRSGWPRPAWRARTIAWGAVSDLEFGEDVGYVVRMVLG